MTVNQFSNAILSTSRYTSLISAKQSLSAMILLSRRSLKVFPDSLSLLDPILKRQASILLAEAFIHLLHLADFFDCSFSDICDYALSVEREIPTHSPFKRAVKKSPLVTMDPIILTEAPSEVIQQFLADRRENSERDQLDG